jgi:hypothetical protein
MARCRYCRGPRPNPMVPYCSSFECKSAYLGEYNRRKREKAAKTVKPARLRQTRSTTTPTKLEREWMDAITDLGCIVCLLKGWGYVPAAVHHLKNGNRRLGHLFSIPLCDPGHHQNALAESGEISRHPNKARFEAAYGTEEELLEKVRRLVKLGRAAA